MAEAGAKAGRDVGNYVLMMVIADETDEAAMAKWTHYNAGTDMGAITWWRARPTPIPAPPTTPPPSGSVPEGASTSTWARWSAPTPRWPACSTIAAVPDTKGIMLTFDDFLIGIERFGQRIQPLMSSRAAKLKRWRRKTPMDFGVFIPIGNNGWLMSGTRRSTCPASSEQEICC